MVQDRPVRAATLGNWFQQGCSLFATAVTLPFIIKHLPAYQVGLWLTFQSCLAVVGLTNFGFSFALSRQTAFVVGARDEKAFAERSDFIRTSLGWDGISELYTAARILFNWSLLVAALLILAAFLFLERTGRVEMGTFPLWLLMGCGLLLNLSAQRFAPFLDGLGFMAYSRGVGGLYQLVWSALAVGTLLVHPSLILLALAILIASILQLTAYRWILFALGGGRLDRRRPLVAGLVKRLFHIAAPLGMVFSASFCVSQVQIPLIGFFLGVEKVTPFYVAQRVGQTLFGLFNQIFQSQMPRFTQELGAADWPRAFHRMRRLLIFAAVGSISIGAAYWAGSPLLVRCWLGTGHYVGNGVLFFMALDYSLIAFTVPWAWFVLASGSNPFVLSTIGNGLLNLLLISALAPRLGLLGLPLSGILAGFATNQLYTVYKGEKLLSKLRRQSL